MIGRLRQLSEPRLRQQAGIEKSETPVERGILVQWVRKRKAEIKIEIVSTVYFDIRGNLEISVFEISRVGCVDEKKGLYAPIYDICYLIRMSCRL